MAGVAPDAPVHRGGPAGTQHPVAAIPEPGGADRIAEGAVIEPPDQVANRARPGIPPEDPAASRASGRPVLAELLAAIKRIDGTPGSAAPSKDLAALLVAELMSANRPGAKGSDAFVTKSLQKLAMEARNASVREGAWGAMAVADGGLAQGQGRPRAQLKKH